MHSLDDATQIPEPPWRSSRPSRPRTYLSRELVVEAALRVLNREGLDGFTMRRVSDELGTTAGALYWHVRNREDLLDLVFDRVLGELKLPPPNPAQWQKQIKELAREWRRVMHDHRDSARIAFGRVPSGPNWLRRLEWMLSVLRTAGLPDEVVARLAESMTLYVHGFVLSEAIGLRIGGEPRSPEEAERMLREYYETPPADQLPNVSELADLLSGGSTDERFEFGLDLLLKGLASYADGTTPKRQTRGRRRN